jgi:hypothetical protein
LSHCSIGAAPAALDWGFSKLSVEIGLITGSPLRNCPHVPAIDLPENQSGDDPGEHSHDNVAREYNRNEKPPPKLRTRVRGRPGPMVLCERPPLMLLLITRRRL